jgi:hypothetical protein
MGRQATRRFRLLMLIISEAQDATIVCLGAEITRCASQIGE